MEIDFQNHRFRFKTDSGVFSKNELDDGTNILLNSLQDIHGRVLDLGCGWGAIGIIVAKLFQDTSVLMCDINERAVALAQKNIRMNGIDRAEVIQSDGFTSVEGSFDVILTNPPIRAGKQVIYGFFAEAAKRLNPYGRLILVIRKQQGAESAVKYLNTIFQTVRLLEKKKGFWIIQCEGGLNDANGSDVF